MTTFTQPLAAPQALTRPLGETTCVVTAGPWLSAMAGQAFAAAVRAAHAGGAQEIVLDLTTVRAADAAGTSPLVALAEELEAGGCELAVASTHPDVATWLDDAAIGARLPVHETVADALADLLRRPL